MPEENKYALRKGHHSYHSSYMTGDLSTQREHVIKDKLQIPVVTLEFFETVTPTIPDAMLQAVFAELKNDGSITKGGRMYGFAGHDPKKSGHIENPTFAHVHKFTEAIIRAGEGYTGQKPCIGMKHNPNSTPYSERENTSRPDGFGSSLVARYHNNKKLPQDPISWSGIILAKEDKKDEADAIDNFKKIMWSGHHILRNDPRRNFCFGMTTENTTCRLWFFARSHIMVSESFNVIIDHAPLVRFILSLSFAHVLSTPPRSACSPLTAQSSQSTIGENTSVESTSGISPLAAQSSRSPDGDTSADVHPLYASVDYDFAWQAHGYDPTIQRLDHGVYRIRVGDKWYITCESLSDFRAECICGRCTRVWRVYEDKKYQPGEEKIYYVLKDVWVDRSNDTEATIWKRLKERVDSKVFDQHFLTLVAALEPDEGATTCSFLKRQNFTPTENMVFMDRQFVSALHFDSSTSAVQDLDEVSRTFYRSRVYIQGAPDVEPLGVATTRRPRYHPRKHDRSVWKEVCTTYHAQRDMQVMFTMLEHAVKALRAMWEGAHAIHRDISTGNILYDDQSKNGCLGDLECVTFYDDEPHTVHNVKTGTLQFMAIEVSDGAYQFEPNENETDVFLAPTDDISPLVPGPVVDVVHPFRHNILHDLESIWWLVMWSIFNYYPDNFSADAKDLMTQCRAYGALFPSAFGNDKDRINAMTNARPRFVSSIAPPFEAVGQLALRLRTMLRVSYRLAEATLPIKSDCPVFQSAHQTTMALLRHMKASLEKDGIKGVTSGYQLLGSAQKRKVEDNEETQEAPPLKK